MSAISRAMLLMICFSLHLGAQSRSLALYAGPASELDPIAIQSAKHELQRLLDPAGIEMQWKTLHTQKAGEQFDQIVVLSFDGSCAEPGAPSSFRVSPEGTYSLADSAVSEGRVLPFVRVDCGYLAQILAPSLRNLSPKQRESVFGRALGRVVAHEIYHIMGETTRHQVRGVAKAEFSVRDLTAENFEFDSASIVLMAAISSFSTLRDSVRR